MNAIILAAALVKASSFGYDASDSTRFLQSALDSGAKTVVVDRVKGPWITTTLYGRSNQTVIFEPGTELRAKRGAFLGLNDCLFVLDRVTNVVVRGAGAMWRMHRADYDAPPYKKGEWRHSLKIISSRHITVEGLTLLESGGDGIYVGTFDGPPSEDIVLRDLVCDRHYRQGASIITVRNLLIERCVFRNTKGTPPAAGIDWEPNHPWEELTDCVMRDCVMEDNQGCGIEMYLGALDGASRPLSILIENCRSRHNIVGVTPGFGKGATHPKGRVILRNCLFKNERGPAARFNCKPLGDAQFVFEKCKFVDCQADAPRADAVTDIRLSVPSAECPVPDGIRFVDCLVHQIVPRDWISRTDKDWEPKGGWDVRDISGKVRVVNPLGKTDVVLDESWRKNYFAR